MVYVGHLCYEFYHHYIDIKLHYIYSVFDGYQKGVRHIRQPKESKPEKECAPARMEWIHSDLLICHFHLSETSARTLMNAL